MYTFQIKRIFLSCTVLVLFFSLLVLSTSQAEDTQIEMVAIGLDSESGMDRLNSLNIDVLPLKNDTLEELVLI